jgi:hypothetical protein
MTYHGIIKLLFHKLLLDEEHFDFANKPKGVLPFHAYQLL